MSGLPSNLNVTATRPGTEPNGLTYWVNYARTRPPEKILRKKNGTLRGGWNYKPCPARRHLVVLCYVEIGDMRLLIGGGDPL
jgi:hypothetical protein